MTDAQKLIDFRKDKNLTQQQLADILGLTQQTIAMVESGKRKAPDSLKLAILRKYKVDFDEQPKITNYEKIKNMTVDEMAEWLPNRAGCCFCIYEFEQDCNQAIGCKGGIKQWLLSEVE